VQQIEGMTPGETMSFSGREVTLVEVVNAPGPNYAAERALFEVVGRYGSTRTISAERRFYPVRGAETAEAGIGGGALGDLYITVGARRDGDSWPVTVSWFPLTRWLWFGATLTVLGAICSIAEHVRAHAGARRERDEPAVAAPAPAE
jgi:cytochrome c-type biogenesis protein CcmF